MSIVEKLKNILGGKQASSEKVFEPSLRVRTKTLDHEHQTYVYEIVSNDDRVVIRKTVHELFNDRELLYRLPPEDVLDVGYFRAMMKY